MPRQLIDNFETTLGAAIATTGATSLTLASGQGARLAALTLSTTDFLPLTITNGTDVEVVHATARATDVLTIVRAREGTTALTFPSGSVVAFYPTAATWSELPVLTTPLSLTAQTTDMTPVAGRLGVQARTKAGWTRLEVMGPSGVDYALQPAFFGNRGMLWKPGSGTTMSSVGLTPTISATASHPAPATTTLAESIYRTRFACSTTAGNSAGARDAVNTIWGGNAAGRGGFLHICRFMSGSINLSGGQQVVGLTSQTTTLAGEPSALPDVLAMIKDSGDTNWFFARRTGTGTVQKVNLSVATAVNQTFDLHLFRRPNASEVFVRIVQWNFDGTSTTLLDTSYTTDIPAAATLLGFICHTRNGVTAAANNIDLAERFTFSDF